MNKDTILEMLNSDSECLSLQEVYNILNEELEKSPEEMDTDLIELCMDAIESANSEKVNNKRVKMRIRKALIAAVIFVLVIAFTIPVCAKYFNINVPDGIVEFYDGCFNVDISNKEYVDDILVELEKNGVENPVLPDIMFKNDSIIYNFKAINDSECKTIIFDSQYKKIKIHTLIQEYDSSFDFKEIQNKLESNTEMLDIINKNNVKIIVYSVNNNYYFEFENNNYHYFIELKNCDYETAYEIANSI